MHSVRGPRRGRSSRPAAALLSIVVAAFVGAVSAREPGAADRPVGWTFSRWPNGWRKLPGDDSPDIFGIEASRYDFTLDIGDLGKAGFRAADHRLGYAAALDAPAGEPFAGLPAAALGVEVEHGGTVYRAVRCRAATASGPKRLQWARLWESGRLVQHYDFQDLTLVDPAGRLLPCAADLDVVGWPDSLTLTLRISPRVPISSLGRATLRVRLDAAEPICAAEKSFADDWPAGEVRELSATYRAPGTAPPAGLTIAVAGRTGDQTFPTAFDAGRACFTATVAGLKRSFAGGYTKITAYDELLVTVDNPGPAAAPVPFLLHLRKPANVTGMCPILCDTVGRPTGVPVQLSKNWHQGEYLMAYAKLPAAVGRTTHLLRIPYGFYGTLPSASHAQLSLVGYGGNGRWDQLAIGCSGETFCLDLDCSLVDVAITDVRMLFTRAGREGPMWQWSDAGWGGDWLGIRDAADRKLPLRDVKAAYLAHGPCLTDVRYAGSYGPRNEVGVSAWVRTLRTDDYARTFHRLAYTFHAETPAATTRFFTQGGGPGYVTPAIAHGNRAGLVAEMPVPPDAKRGAVLVDRVTLPGAGPWWVAFPDASTRAPGKGAGSRGLVIRSYAAAFGGTTVDRPTITMAVGDVRRDGGGADVHLWLVPPPDVERIRPGDRVEFDAEWITLPRCADDYYGPNEAFRRHLAEHPGSWQTVHREAAGNALEVTADGGDVLGTYPVVVRVTGPAVKVTIKGGVGCVPIRFEGLPAADSHRLFRVIDGAEQPLDQAVHGNDFWQVDRDDAAGTCAVSYNLPLDGVAESTWILREAAVPGSVEELWDDFDPRRDPLETEVIREWREDGGVYRHVRFLVGTFKGRPARMAAVYGFPEQRDGQVPAVMHIHGGGQRGSLDEVKFLVGRGYAALSVNWGGRGGSDGPFNAVQVAEPGDPNTDWGAVDPSQCNVQGYSTLLPGPLQFYEDREHPPTSHPKNNNWYLLTLGCRRGLTFLEQQPEVDPARLGVHGYSMGGNLTMYVAGTDDRVKAAVPAVGGAGWRWEPRVVAGGTVPPQDRVQGDVDLFRRTLSFESYAPRIRCPVLHRSATNDFHGRMDDVYRTHALIPGQPLRYSWTPHVNHRLMPEVAVTMPLWFDHFLKGGPALPETPRADLVLDAPDGVPRLCVRADGRWPIEACEIYSSCDPDPQARFWRSADVVREGDAFVAELPLHAIDRPLYAFANVRHALPEPVSMAAIPGHRGAVRSVILSSELRTASPADLETARAKATRPPSTLLDDFAHGWRDWYRLNTDHPGLWENWTRKVTDPVWRGPAGAALAVTLVMPRTNRMKVVVVQNEWRGERGPRKTFSCVREIMGSTEPQTVIFTRADFAPANEKDGPLASWDEVDLLGLCGTRGATGQGRSTGWDGPDPEFRRVEWRH